MRSTRDVVLIVFAVTAGAVVWTALAGLLAIELINPRTDTGPGISVVWNVAALMLGAVAGYLIARRSNGNGH